MSNVVEKRKCIKLKNVLIDATVEADLSGMLPYSYRIEQDVSRRADMLKSAIKDFMEFMRDHRSQDMVVLSVIKSTEDLCSNCKGAWETYEEDGKKYCASCGAEVEEQE